MNGSLRRSALLAWVVFAVPAFAGLQGSGRVTLQPGWRFGLNAPFYSGAAAGGFEREKTLNGGPALLTVFGYNATDLIEVSIDPFIAYEQLKLVGVEPLNAVTYGAMVSVRLQGEFLLNRLLLGIGLSTGGVLVNVTGGDEPPVESFAPAFGGTAGGTLRLTENLGLSLEYKLILGQGVSTRYGEVRGNGHFVGIGLTYFFGDLGGRQPLTN